LSENLASNLQALRAREIPFEVFHRRTRDEWRRMAVALHRRYTLPPGVTADDVEQEMLFGCWVAVSRWEDDRGVSLVSYVVWGAHNRAQKWIQRQRGVNQHTRRGPAGYAFCASALTRDGDDGGPRVLENATAGARDRERDLDVQALLAMIPRVASSEAGKQALRRFFEQMGDVEKAAEAFYGDPEHRWLFRLESRHHARSIITQEVRRLRAVLAE
jgi:hypothetical protein